MANHYQILGISPSASPELVREAYEDLAQRMGPSAFHSRYRKSAQGRWEKLHEAYRILSDPPRRAQYDRWLRHMATAKPSPWSMLSRAIRRIVLIALFVYCLAELCLWATQSLLGTMYAYGLTVLSLGALVGFLILRRYRKTLQAKRVNKRPQPKP